MADLLTHVLVAYILATLLSFRYTWITRPYVTAAMVGAIVSDLSRLSLVLPDERVETLLGVPFEWFAFHTLGGGTLAITIGALCTSEDHRRRVFAMLLLGLLSHLMLDALLIKPSGYAAMLLWPITATHPPAAGLYESSDRWPVILAGLAAISVWVVRRRFLHEPDQCRI